MVALPDRRPRARRAADHARGRSCTSSTDPRARAHAGRRSSALAELPLILADASYGTRGPHAPPARRAGAARRRHHRAADRRRGHRGRARARRRGLGDTIARARILLAMGRRVSKRLGWVPFADPITTRSRSSRARNAPLSPASREFLELGAERLAALAAAAARPSRRASGRRADVSRGAAPRCRRAGAAAARRRALRVDAVEHAEQRGRAAGNQTARSSSSIAATTFSASSSGARRAAGRRGTSPACGPSRGRAGRSRSRPGRRSSARRRCRSARGAAPRRTSAARPSSRRRPRPAGTSAAPAPRGDDDDVAAVAPSSRCGRPKWTVRSVPCQLTSLICSCCSSDWSRYGP